MALALALVLAATAQAGAFGTISSLGQDAEHERITRRALTCPPGVPSDNSCFEALTLDELAGKSGTFGAVGIPDRGTLIADESYHCDGGDHLAIRGYPQSAAKARRTIARCRGRMVQNMNAAVARAAALLDDKGRIRADQVTLGCVFVGTMSGRAKCNVLESLGLVLHTSQDFYSHTNWTDRPAPGAIGPGNPPGLARNGRSPYIDLRGPQAFPSGLISGCFGSGPVILRIPGVLGKPEAKYCNYGFLGSLNRVKHRDLNKDEGTIDPAIKAAGRTARGKVRGNFGRAVRAAVSDTGDKWATLSERLVAVYGPKRGALMICAIVRDDPVKDCQGLTVALVIDSSGSNTGTDPANLRIGAGLSVAERLVGAAEAPEGPTDRLAVVDFDSSARLTYPLGDPDGAGGAIRAIDSSGGTSIASGIAAATSEITAGAGAPGRSGIVVLTDGQDSDTGALVGAINAAGAAGIRVSIGFLSPPSAIVANERRSGEHQLSRGAAPEVQAAVIATGGVFGTIRSAEEQQAFTDLVEERGVTAVDDPDGIAEGGDIGLGVEVAGSLGGGDTWTYAAAAREGVRIVLSPPDGATGRLRALTSDGRTTSAKGTAPGAEVALPVKTARAGTLRVTVAGSGSGVYALRIDPDTSAPLAKRPRVKAQVVAARVLRAAKLSLTRNGRAVRNARFRRAAYLTWRVRTKGTTLTARIAGPRGVTRTARVRLRTTKKATTRRIVATLPIIGTRRGTWTVELRAGRTVIDSLVVRTR
jgi:hypothetical protein